MISFQCLNSVCIVNFWPFNKCVVSVLGNRPKACQLIDSMCHRYVSFDKISSKKKRIPFCIHWKVKKKKWTRKKLTTTPICHCWQNDTNAAHEIRCVFFPFFFSWFRIVSILIGFLLSSTFVFHLLKFFVLCYVNIFTVRLKRLVARARAHQRYKPFRLDGLMVGYIASAN